MHYSIEGCGNVSPNPSGPFAVQNKYSKKINHETLTQSRFMAL